MDGLESKSSPLKEWEFWLLAALTAAIYFSRVGDLPIRGEETRRAMVAWEILQTGDWVVPHQQGEPFLSRPPAGSYPIAWATWLFGDLSLWAVRLPTVVATLLTALLVYAYSRQFLARYAALCAGLCYATFIQVLQLGRVAETEATFTLFVSGALLIWHWGYTAQWLAAKTWCLAYLLVAIATLVKSLQAPVYFCGAVGFFLLWQRDWRYLFSRAHLCGLLTFAVVFGAWQIPFYERLGWDAVRQVWAGDVGLRFAEGGQRAFVNHLLTYPIEIGAALCPWSLLLPAYLWPQFRRVIGSVKPMVVFLVIAWLVALPTCWLVPNARPRYIMPLYPLAAPLVGLIAQRVVESKTIPIVRFGWLFWAFGMMLAVVAGGGVVAAASWPTGVSIPQIAQSDWFAGCFLAAAIFAGFALARTWNRWTPNAIATAVVALAAFLGFTASGTVVNSLIALDSHTGDQIGELKARLQHEKPMVSIGQVGTIFSYYWREPIPIACERLPSTCDELSRDFEYFCFDWSGAALPQFPFPWRVEALIDCDREADGNLNQLVVIGRREVAVALLPDEAMKRE